MKRKTELLSKSENGTIKITIELITSAHKITRDESSIIEDKLIDGIISAICVVPYLCQYPHKVKVK